MNIFLKLGDIVCTVVTLGFVLSLAGSRDLGLLVAMCLRRKPASSKVQSVEEQGRGGGLSLLDLPELAIETVLSKLPPQSLCRVASVSKELYRRSTSDHLWIPHVQEKWSRAAGPAAFREWQAGHFSACKSDDVSLCKPLSWPLSCLWSSWSKTPPSTAPPPPPSSSSSSSSSCSSASCSSSSAYVKDGESSLDHGLYMRWYTTLETGAFWFPAQVYNREHGHVGFLLSCYDAELRYDRQTNTFTARYPPHGSCSLLIEEGVTWQRLRAPPAPATAHELYISQHLDDLRPGDHVEVQWRRNKRFPYGWWYGVVGHLEGCSGDSLHCHCHLDDTVWLEFNQYAPGSRWRRTSVDRKSHVEKGNDAEGFYAGVRKLQTKEEISAWKDLWPKEVLE